MAFENVFGNVDFQAPERQKAAQNQQMMQLMGRAIEGAQFNRQMDLKERQLEAKGSEFNLKRTAENALLKQNMGMPLTPQEQASIQTMGQIAPPTFGVDEFGRPVSRPSGWGSIGAKPPAESQMMGLMGNTGQGQGSNPAITQSYGNITPDILSPMGENDVLAQLQGTPVASQSSIPPQGLPNTPNYDSSPVGEITAGKAKTELAKYAAEKDIDLQFMDEKQKRELAFEMAREQNKASKEKDEKKPQEVLAIESAFQEAGNMNSTIKDIYDSAGIMTTGLIGQKTSGIGGSPAKDLAANLKTIEADAGLSKLIEVKERGGTFGALQEKELDLLINSRAALDQTQSPDQFKENLIKYQQQRNKTMGLMANFFEERYGTVPDGLLEGLDENIIDPRTEAAKQGKVFINQAGEKIKWSNGEWKKL